MIGRDSWGDDVFLDIALPSHVICQGGTRSGKSVFAYCLLARVSVLRNVLVGGCDPSGLLLHPWRNAPKPHLRSFGNGVAAHEAALRQLTLELDRRVGDLLAEGVDKVDWNDSRTPIILVVLEEYPGLLVLAEAHDGAEGLRGKTSLAASIRRSVARLVQEGAKAAIRVLLLTQRADAAIVGGAERSNFGTRISFRLDNGDAVRMLHPQATDDIIRRILKSVQGVGYIDTPRLDATFFRSDYVEYRDYTRSIEFAYPEAVS